MSYRESKPYSADQRRLVHQHIRHILSVDSVGAIQLLDSITTGKEIEQLALLFRSMSPGEDPEGMQAAGAGQKTLEHTRARPWARKWPDALLCHLPVSTDWPAADMQNPIAAPHSGSLAFLGNYDDADVASVGRIEAQVEGRKALHEGLLALVPAGNPQIEAMLAWQCLPEAADQVSAGDTAFGLSLGYLEYFMVHQAASFEAGVRKLLHLTDDVSTPPHMVKQAWTESLALVIAKIDDWCLVGSKNKHDQLAVRLSANASVNRAILEHGQKLGLVLGAFGWCSEPLTALNKAGLREIPALFTDKNLCSDLSLRFCKLRDWLRQQFGAGGRNASVLGGRRMGPADIENAVSWAKALQKDYVRRQSIVYGHPGPGMAHDHDHNAFIFGLVMVLAFYAPAKIPQELKHGKTNYYALFPDSPGHTGLIPAHARAVLSDAYSMIFYSGNEYQVIADNLVYYADLSQHRKACLQHLLYHSVKNRTSGELLALYNALSARVKSH